MNSGGWRLWAGVVFALGAIAQSDPQFIWEGKVDGVALIRVHGKKATIETKQGRPPEVRRSRLTGSLPDSAQTVRLEVRQSRGGIRITQQPRLENDYELIVTIEDLQDGAGDYSFGLRWSSDRGSYSADPKPWDTRDPFDKLTWSGRVDGEVVVECRERTCVSRAQTGPTASKEKYKFTGPLPAVQVTVKLDETDGRGQIKVLEQPSKGNGYTVRVLVKDDQPGSGPYSFVLSWPRVKVEADRR